MKKLAIALAGGMAMAALALVASRASGQNSPIGLMQRFVDGLREDVEAALADARASAATRRADIERDLEHALDPQPK
jgi:outer membrane murein-binding lipoprotein Lpp